MAEKNLLWIVRKKKSGRKGPVITAGRGTTVNFLIKINLQSGEHYVDNGRRRVVL
jgi:hypothetical protein